LLLAVFSVVATLLLLEGLLHLFPDLLPWKVRYYTGRDIAWRERARFRQKRRTIHVEDSYLGYKLKPHVDILLKHPEFTFRVQTNSLGFRDGEIETPVFAVALGDSFTFGYGLDVEDSWVERLEEKVGAEVANLGVSGYSAIQSTRMLERCGKSLKPRLVLWGFSPNDLTDNEIFDRWWTSGTAEGFREWGQRMREMAAEEGEDTSQQGTAGGRGPLYALRAFLRRHSILYELVKFALNVGVYGEGGSRSGNLSDIVYDDGELHFVFHLGSYWLQRIDLSRPEVQRGWELAQEVILKAQSLAEEEGADFVVLLFPFKEQVYWHVVSRFIDEVDQDFIDRPIELAKQFCEENGIRYLDLTPGFREHALQGEQLYFREDGHWNEEGNRLAADLIYDYLVKNDLLPEE